MSFEFDNKGKIYTDVIPKTAIPALVQTTTHLIQGKVYLRRENRLIDELDQDEMFLAITDASIFGSGEEAHREAPFLAVFEQISVSQDGKVLGELKPTGIRPLFTPHLEAAGYKLGAEIFGATFGGGNRRLR